MNCLTKENSNCLKGIFALCILAHHLYQYIGLGEYTHLGSSLERLGYLSVAVFLFLSGYGVTYNTIHNAQYIRQFWGRRLLPYYSVYVFTILIYSLYFSILGISFSLTTYLKSFFFGDTIVVNGWYFQTLLVLYLIFYFSFRFGGRYKYLLLFIGTFAYCCICFLINPYSHLWYEAVLGFPIGVIFADKNSFFEKQILNKRLYPIFILSTLFMYYLTADTTIRNLLPPSVPLRIILRMCSCVFFVVIIVLLISRIRINYRFTQILGKYSLEIYALQGIGLTLFHSDKFMISNNYVYTLAVCLLTFVLSFITHPLFRKRSIVRT